MIHPYYEISVHELAQLLEDNTVKDFEVIDVREHSELERAALDFVTHIPMDEITGRLQALDQEKFFIIMCHHGKRSLYVTQLLRDLGFDRVKSLKGGIDAWSREIDPKIARY